MVDNQTLKELKAEKSALSSTVVKRQKEADALQEQVGFLARGGGGPSRALSPLGAWSGLTVPPAAFP